jgi:hypothetical protein
MNFFLKSSRANHDANTQKEWEMQKTPMNTRSQNKQQYANKFRNYKQESIYAFINCYLILATKRIFIMLSDASLTQTNKLKE